MQIFKRNSPTTFQYFHYFDYLLSTKLGAFHILKIDFDGVWRWIWFSEVQSWFSIVKCFKDLKKQPVLTLFRATKYCIGFCAQFHCTRLYSVYIYSDSRRQSSVKMNAFVYTEFSHDPIIKHILFLIHMDIFNNICSKLVNFNFF